jgi:hypothetical protein
MNRLLASAICGVALGAVLTGVLSGQEKPPLTLRDTIRVAAFSSPLSTHPLPVDWLPLIFDDEKAETDYRIDRKGGRNCLLAEARSSGSGLLKLIGVDPGSLAVLKWSWWVDGPVPAGDWRTKEGDDFAARIFVNFRFDPSKSGILDRIRHRLARDRFGGEAPGRSLVYVFGNRAPKGTMAPSAYTDKAVHFVVRSGREESGRWWTEERDLLQDFREAFQDEPPEIVSVAVMTDTDDTGGLASACYGEILLFSQ